VLDPSPACCELLVKVMYDLRLNTPGTPWLALVLGFFCVCHIYSSLQLFVVFMALLRLVLVGSSRQFSFGSKWCAVTVWLTLTVLMALNSRVTRFVPTVSITNHWKLSSHLCSMITVHQFPPRCNAGTWHSTSPENLSPCP